MKLKWLQNDDCLRLSSLRISGFLHFVIAPREVEVAA
jgi:hypothetical protein